MDGVTHRFPADATDDEIRAVLEGAASQGAKPPEAPEWWPRDRFGNPISTPDHPLDESGQPANWADRTFSPPNLDKAQIAADLITPLAGIAGGPKPMGGLRFVPTADQARGGAATALEFVGDKFGRFDITHPGGLIRDAAKWVGGKVRPTPATPTPTAPQMPTGRTDLMSGLRLREAIAANEAPPMQPASAAPPPPPAPIPQPQPPVSATDRLQALRQQQLRETPAAADPARAAWIDTLRQRMNAPETTGETGTLTGQKSPTVQQALIDALLEQTGEKGATAATRPVPRLPSEVGGVRPVGETGRPPIQIAPETQAALDAPAPSPASRQTPKIDIEGNITPSKSKRGASATAGLSQGDMRRLGLDPNIRLTRATPDTLRQIEVLRAQAQQGYISEAEFAKRGRDALARDQP
jgi:hypothetical protein